jgi:uncharacterized membrane protein
VSRSHAGRMPRSQRSLPKWYGGSSERPNFYSQRQEPCVFFHHKLIGCKKQTHHCVAEISVVSLLNKLEHASLILCSENMMSDETTEEVLKRARQRINQRRESEQSEREQAYQDIFDAGLPWRYAFVSLIAVLVLGLLLAPGMSLDQKMYAVLHGMCSQQHNIVLGGIQFPICARCSGIYISALVTMIYFWVIGRGHAGRVAPWPIVGVMIVFVLGMVADGFHSMTVELGIWKLYEPRNDVRTLTGIGVGMGIAILLLMMYNTVLRTNVDDNLPTVKNWRELAGVVALNFLIMVAIYGNFHLMAWPLAIMAFVGMIGVVYSVNLLLVSLFMGYDGTISNLKQLAKPATIALLPTILLLWGMAFLRYWLEAQGFMPQV